MPKDFSSTVVQIMPALRDREVLIAEIGRSQTGTASDTARAAIAEIELAIRTADADDQRGAYDAALRGYQRARGLIFRLLHPRFDISQWVRDDFRVRLPVGPTIETGLLQAASSLVGLLRPAAAELPTLPKLATVELDGTLTRFTQTGFRRQVGVNEDLEASGTQALALMADGKPQQAVPVLQAALEDAGANADPVARASSQLNLAVALLQSGAVGRGREAAAQAAQTFTAAKDQVGLAQALHAQAVAAHAAGDEQAADDLFAQADEALGLTREAPPGGPPLVQRVGPQPFGPAPNRVLFGGQNLINRLRGRDVFGQTDQIEPAVSVVAGVAAGLSGRSDALVDAIRNRDVTTLAVRVPGRIDGWQVLPAPDAVDRAVAASAWQVGVPVGSGVVDFAVTADKSPAVADLSQLVYEPRARIAAFADLRLVAVDAVSTSTYLTHLYAYSLLVKIGDAQHALGLFAEAEASFQEAAGYTFLNQTVEATALWIRLARNAFEWGNSRYKAEDLAGAKDQYVKLVAADSTVPAGSLLYATASLTVPADQARDLIAHLVDRPLPSIQWEIAAYVLQALSFLDQLSDGLDYYGLAFSPIHTFEYLQSVARGFAQQAIQAEREYVNFRSRQQIETATRRDLASTSALAWAEASGREEQFRSAQADAAGAQAALDLAVRRRNDAVTQRDAYAASSWTQIWSSAASTAQGMGSDSWFNEISELADKLDRGESIHGERGKLAAAYTFQAGRRNRNYELAKMADGIAELNAAIPVAQAQLSAAQHGARAAEIAWQASIQRAQLADAALTAFDQNEFTPEAWSAMADVMRDISRGYLWRAIRIAKLMERAYNFENDTQLHVVKNDYGYAIANASGSDAVLLGGDGLAADIESFTYIAITTARRKQSRVKDVVSLARDFPAHFQSFRATGRLAFETDLYEFDRLHPGFYQQRIEAVELEFVGLVPEEGLNGTLAAGGATRFRQRDGGVGQRVHQIDTMALSDFQLRNDLFVYTADTGVRGLFQGLGLGTTWELVLPKRSNDFDFGRIADVHLVVYYTATYDLGLRTAVLHRPPRPGELSAVRDFNLRYDAPDAWYGFYRNRAVDFELDAVRLPANQQDFAVETVQLRVQTRPELDPEGIVLRVTAPGQPVAEVTTDAGGAVDLTAVAAGLVDASPLGVWHLELTGATPADQVVSIQLGLEYAFSYPDEEV